MLIYGVAALSICLLLGKLIGEVLGLLLGIDANVGGVGIAMLLLLALVAFKNVRAPFAEKSEQGVLFWSGMYIPIVVAMAAKQNVVAAVSGGWLAMTAGVAAVLVSFAMVPLLTRLGGRQRS